MDLDDPDLAALEEKLYSSFHHSYNATTNNEDALQSHASATSTPLRIVTKTSVVNNCTPNTGSRTMRYWALSSGGESMTLKKPFLSERKSGGNPKQKPPEEHTQASPASTGVERGEPKKAFFTPYQSLLNSSSLNSDTSLPTTNGTIVFDKVREVQIASEPTVKEKKLKKKQHQALNPVEKRLAGLVKVIEGSTRAETVKKCVQAKKAKATVVRQKLASKSGSSKSQFSVVAEITLESSDDETKLPLQRGKQQPKTVEPSDDETNDVVLVPGPEVPQICIDCSDDEAAQDSFVLPMLKRQKKKVSPSANSPRCLSPTNSSIMSDDFIGHLDRSRMNDSLGESIPNDEELDCTLNESFRARPGKKKTTASNAPKRLRVPSISSDCTIASNSDTTDPDKRHPPVPKAKKAKSKSLPPSRSATPCQSEKVLEGTTKPSGSLLPRYHGECIPLKAKRGMKSKGKSKNVESAVLSNCSEPASSVNAELTVKKQAVNNVVLKTNCLVGKDALSGRMVKSKNKSKNASHLEESTNAETADENFTQNISPDEDSVYKQVTRKLKDAKACFDESSVSSESDYDLSTVLDKSTVSRKTIGSASETTTHALETISSESDCEDLVITTPAKRATANDLNAGGTTQGSKKKSLGPKRKKFHSENLSDEDFACVLTDIVQAISDGDDDDDDDDHDSGGGVGGSGVGAACNNDLEKDVSVDYWLDAEIQSVNESSLNLHEESDAQGPLLASDVASAPVPVPALPPTPVPAPVITINDSGDDVVQVEDIRFVGVDDSSPGVMGDAGCVWNKEMALFYNSTVTEDNFSMAAAIRKMPRDAKHWQIVDKDRSPDPPKKDMLCNNCGERGHMRFKCRNAPKLRICHMCGQQGHQEPRCPKTMCLNCGSRTETFVYECGTCRNDFRRFCYICGVRGHTTVRCPDHWRRYHSTTEDNVQLVENYQRNRDTKQCSVCGKFGHYAHGCRTAHRIFVHPIPTMEIKSYHPAYHRTPMRNRDQKSTPYTGQDECSRYNLFGGDASKCELNLEALSMNSNGFYYRFAQSAGLLSEPSTEGVLPDAATDRATKAYRTRKSYQNHKRPSQDDDQQSDNVSIPQQQSPIVLEEQLLKRTEVPNGNATMACSVARIEEDSNYSFSELLEDESKLSCDATVAGKSDSVETSEPFHNADFISLTTQPEDEAMLHVSDSKKNEEKQHASTIEVSDAKICLMKPHVQLLISGRGRKFLTDASTRHMLKWSITFESIGNVLLVSGTASNQDAFHRELVGFLQRTDDIWLGTKVPGERKSAVRYIRKHLDLLTKSYENVETIFARYQQLEGQMKWRESERVRRLLNVVLFGQWGMRKGRTHIQRLLTTKNSLERSEEPEVEPKARDVINDNIRYIFSSYDHGDYEKIIAEFKDLRKNQQLKKISCQELGMSEAEAKAFVTREDEYAIEQSAALDLNDSAESLAVQGAQHVEDGSSTDIILNTADGRIHSPVCSAGWQEAKMSETVLFAQPYVPHERKSAVRFIKKYLKLLTKSYGDIERIFAHYQQLQLKLKKGIKKRIQRKKLKLGKIKKQRRKLNIILFGVWGMHEGRTHIQRLLTSKDSLERSEEPEVEPKARDMINDNMRYIFSSYDHGDYEKIIAEFKDLRKNQQLKKISCQELGMSEAEAKAFVTREDENAIEQSAALDLNDSAESLAVQGAQHVEDGSSTDIILNTADGRIHSPVCSAGWQEAKMIETVPFAQPNSTLPQPMIEDSYATTNSAGGNMSIQAAQSSLQTLIGLNEQSTFHWHEQQQKILELLTEITQMKYQKMLERRSQIRLSNLMSDIREGGQTTVALARRDEQSRMNLRLHFLRDLKDIQNMAYQGKLSPESQQRLCATMATIVNRTHRRTRTAKRAIKRMDETAARNSFTKQKQSHQRFASNETKNHRPKEPQYRW